MNRTLRCYWACLAFVLSSSALPAQNSIPQVSDSLALHWQRLEGPPAYVHRYAQAGNTLVAATAHALFTSTDGGQNWRQRSALDGRDIRQVFANDHCILVETLDWGPYPMASSQEEKRYHLMRSADQGLSWQDVLTTTGEPADNGEPTYYRLSDIVSTDDSTLAFYAKSPVSTLVYYWRSTNYGQSWTAKNLGFRFEELSATAGALSGVWHPAYPDPITGFFSADAALATYQTVDLSGLPAGFPLKTFYRNGRFGVFLPDGTLRSTADLGAHWLTMAFPIDSVLQIIWADSVFFLRTATGVWRGDSDSPLPLVKVYAGEGSLSASAQCFNATQAGYWVNASNNQTLISVNEGSSWEPRSRGLSTACHYFAPQCGQLWARVADASGQSSPWYHSNEEDGEWMFVTDGVYYEEDFSYFVGEANGWQYRYAPPWLRRSSDCGATWEILNQQTLGARPSGITQDGDRVYFFSELDFKFTMTQDNGMTWTTFETSAPNGIQHVIAHGDTILAVSGGFSSLEISLFRSFDFGQHWQEIKLTHNTIPMSKIFEKDGLLIGLYESNTVAKAYISTDWGDNWTETFETTALYGRDAGDVLARALRFPFFHQGMLFLLAGEGLHVSENGGMSWTRIIDLPFKNLVKLDIGNSSYYSLKEAEGAWQYRVDDAYLYAISENQGIWRTPLSLLRDYLLVNVGEWGWLKGRVFRDLDATCHYEPGGADVPLGGRSVRIDPVGIYAITDPNGNFSAALPPGSYTVQTPALQYHDASCLVLPSMINITPGGTAVEEIAFTPLPGNKDLAVQASTLERPRPGFQTAYKLQFINSGTDTLNAGQAIFSFQNQWLEGSQALPYGQFSGNEVLIDLPSLAPGQVASTTIRFNVQAAAPLDELLLFSLNCPVAGDSRPENNSLQFDQVISGSFDPNDKTAQPVSVLPPGQPRLLDFLIRFQNTGTDTAFSVVITDTLDARLDPLTLQVQDASHPYALEILPGHVFRCTFRDILLPDSNINEAGSHGFVRFSIETYPAVLPGVPIGNDADIFFDFNSPVRTNRIWVENSKWLVVNTQAVELCAGESFGGISWLHSGALSDTLQSPFTDTVNITQVQVLPTFLLEFDTTVAAGTEFLGLTITGDTSLQTDYLSASGCDSIVLWQVMVQTVGTANSQNLPGINIFPNPAKDAAWIMFIGDVQQQALQVNLLDMVGRVLSTWQQAAGPFTGRSILLDLSGLPPGTYCLELRLPGSIFMRRLVKE